MMRVKIYAKLNDLTKGPNDVSNSSSSNLSPPPSKRIDQTGSNIKLGLGERLKKV